MEVNPREVPLYVSDYILSLSVHLRCVGNVFFCLIRLAQQKLPSLQPSLSSLSADSPSVRWLTSKPCVAGETQASRVSVPGEARLLHSRSPHGKGF